ncbi:hypothetical protein Anapl_08846 [Anas platyrhynchos]|uniref:Uncharacterized protein n=1 Tax=Anas platyrhynchos TaxID=8839 RepID=R0JPL7_ANAPL|nr:hypothetical protein Anapl_08846 [Anas platyrhynchos]
MQVFSNVSHTEAEDLAKLCTQNNPKVLEERAVHVEVAPRANTPPKPRGWRDVSARAGARARLLKPLRCSSCYGARLLLCSLEGRFLLLSPAEIPGAQPRHPCPTALLKAEPVLVTCIWDPDVALELSMLYPAKTIPPLPFASSLTIEVRGLWYHPLPAECHTARNTLRAAGLQAAGESRARILALLISTRMLVENNTKQRCSHQPAFQPTEPGASVPKADSLSHVAVSSWHLTPAGKHKRNFVLHVDRNHSSTKELLPSEPRVWEQTVLSRNRSHLLGI